MIAGEEGDSAGCAPGSANDRLLTRCLWAAFALALFVRVAFLWSKPLWRDEAWVALLAADPMSAATDARATPLGFVFLTRLTSAIPLLPPEITYRIVPLVAGLAAIPLIAKLATALGASRRTGVIAAWIAAGLHPLVYYSREVKSYDLDLLLAILLPLLALRGFTGDAPSARARGALLGALVVGPWISFAGIFPTGAVLSWGWLAWWKGFTGALRRDWFVCSAAFLVSFAVVYVVALGAQSTSEMQYQFWDKFLVQGGRASFFSQASDAVVRYVSIVSSYPFGDYRKPAMLLATIGAWTWPRAQRGYFFWLVGAMAGLCLLATVLDRYLIAQGRHLLFAVPALILCIAHGLDEIGQRLGRRAGTAVVLAVPMLVSFSLAKEQIDSRTRPFHSNWTRYFRFDVLHDVEKALDHTADDIPDDEPLLVTSKNSYAFQFYRKGRLPNATYCKLHCFDFRDRSREWLDSVERRGWILMTDEETKNFDKLLRKNGFGYRPNNVASGIRLWEIEREKPKKPVRRNTKAKNQRGAGGSKRATPKYGDDD